MKGKQTLLFYTAEVPFLLKTLSFMWLSKESPEKYYRCIIVSEFKNNKCEISRKYISVFITWPISVHLVRRTVHLRSQTPFLLMSSHSLYKYMDLYQFLDTRDSVALIILIFCVVIFVLFVFVLCLVLNVAFLSGFSMTDCPFICL